MAQAAMPLQPNDAATEIEKSSSSAGWGKLARFTLTRLFTQSITVVIAIYVTILIANMGGAVDNIRKGMIRENTAMSAGFSDDYRRLQSADERREWIDKRVAIAEQSAGLDQPFAVRSVRYLTDALTLNLGRAENMFSDSGSRLVRNIILERLPPTLILFATANFLMFFITLFVSLYLSRNYGSFLDKFVLAFAPTSAAPSWFYALFLILVFAGGGILPYGGMVSSPPPDTLIGYSLSVLKHMILPITAIAIGGLFAGIYGSRTFFLIYSKEDYVDMAHAKGLHPRTIERRYILRPTLPVIVTGFALGLIAMWTGSVTLETIFNWPGLGRLLFQAANAFDTPVIVGSTVIYAYLLAITVFLLDITYAMLDPRLKVGDGGAK